MAVNFKPSANIVVSQIFTTL